MKTIAMTLVLGSCLILSGCYETNEIDEKQTEATEAFQKQAYDQAGMPAITNFTERKNAKMILEKRDDADLITYTYLVDMNGNLKFLTKSLGYGVPYSTQYTNPERVSYTRGGSFYTIPQPEPNGLFMPTSSSATWILVPNPNGEIDVLYVEPLIIVSPFKLD